MNVDAAPIAKTRTDIRIGGESLVLKTSWATSSTLRVARLEPKRISRLQTNI